MQVEGPFADIEGLEKSSSDGLVKEVLIWLHKALILLSPSPGNPMSISGTSKKEKHSGRRGGGERAKVWKDGDERRRGGGRTNKQRDGEKVFNQLRNRPS